MAFNLWNGYIEDDHPVAFTPNELFSCELASEFQQAIKLRYPDNFRERESVRKKIEVLQKTQEPSKDRAKTRIDKEMSL